MIKGTFISMWEEGVVRTPAILNEQTGEISTESADVDGLEHLLDEQFETEDGEIYDVCTECHEYVLKDKKCTNPNCDNK